MSFMNIAMAKFNIEFSVTQCRSIGAWTPKICGSIPSGEVHISFFPTLFAKKKRMEYSNVLNQILDSYFLRSLIIFVISYGKSTFPLKLFFTNCRISRYLQQYTNGFKDELRKTMNPEML